MRIKTTPAGSRTGAPVDLDERPEDREYIALRHVRIGDSWREPGSLLTAAELAGRNVDAMLRYGLIGHYIAPRRPAAKPRKRSATR